MSDKTPTSRLTRLGARMLRVSLVIKYPEYPVGISDLLPRPADTLLGAENHTRKPAI